MAGFKDVTGCFVLAAFYKRRFPFKWSVKNTTALGLKYLIEITLTVIFNLKCCPYQIPIFHNKTQSPMKKKGKI